MKMFDQIVALMAAVLVAAAVCGGLILAAAIAGILGLALMMAAPLMWMWRRVKR